MSRAFIIILLYMVPVVIALTLPSISDEFNFRDFGFANYPGYSSAQLGLLSIALAVGGVGAPILATWLFHRDPPPMHWPRIVTWWVAFSLVIFVCLARNIVGLVLSGCLLRLLFSSPRLRFWGTALPDESRQD